MDGGYAAAGMRRHPGLAAAAAGLPALAGIFTPYGGFAALYLAAFCCRSLYTNNEPLRFVLLPAIPAGRFLVGKIATAWRNFLLGTLPAATVTIACHPHAAWLAAAWGPASALALACFITAKYARYDPAVGKPGTSSLEKAGFAGLILPPLLPLTLILLVTDARRAERTLNRYLHDYD